MRPGYNCERQGLAPLQGVAGLCLLKMGGRRYCLAASDDAAGSCILLGLEKRNYFPVQPLGGRILSLTSVADRQGLFLAAVQRDMAQPASTELVLSQIIPQMVDGALRCETVTLLELPFLQQIWLTERRLMVVMGKDGSACEISLDEDLAVLGDPNPVLPGIGTVATFCGRVDVSGEAQLLISGSAGAFVLTLQDHAVWMIQRLSGESGGSSCWIGSGGEVRVIHSKTGVFCRDNGRWQSCGTETLEACSLWGGTDCFYASHENGDLILCALQDDQTYRELLRYPRLFVKEMLPENGNSLLAAVSGENRIDRFRVS